MWVINSDNENCQNLCHYVKIKYNKDLNHKRIINCAAVKFALFSMFAFELFTFLT